MPSPQRLPATQTEIVRVRRQAIVDRDLKVFGYELLYRDSAQHNASFAGNGDFATCTTLINSFLEIGLHRLVGSNLAFVNFTRTFFVELPPLPFDQDQIVIELLEDISVDEQLIAAVKNLAELGYSIAVDGYEFESKWDPLLPYVDYIKVEVNERTMLNMAERVRGLKQHNVKILAEKVETQAQFRELRDMGFDLFQGYFLARPDILEAERRGENQALLMQLLAQLNNPQAEIPKVIRIVSQDPALSVKILRIVNSAALGLSNQIESIGQAVMLLGISKVRAWTTLFMLAQNRKAPPELMNIGLLRARICEQLSMREKGLVPDTAYPVGLLSILDAMMSIPMQKLMAELPPPDDIRSAISDQAGPYGRLL